MSGEVDLGGNAQAVLKTLTARIERLEEEKAEVGGQVKDVYAEAKSQGFDTKAMRAMIRRRRMDKQARDEFDAILETYEAAIYAGAEGLV